MIVEGILGVAAFGFCFYLVLKLIDQAKLKKLARKYPEGTETVSRPVSNFKSIERNNIENKILSVGKIDNIDSNKIMEKLSNEEVNTDSE